MSFEFKINLLYYKINSSSGVACENQCSRKGNCVNNAACACNPGYSGTFCQQGIFFLLENRKKILL